MRRLVYSQGAGVTRIDSPDSPDSPDPPDPEYARHMVAVEVVALAVLGAWLGFALVRARRWPGELLLDRDVERGEPDRSDCGGTVVALVPARDEAATLPETLPTLLRQSPPLAAVVLVDDGSSDDTVELARSAAEAVGAADRLVVVAAGEPASGWSGKLHALERGRREIGERWGDDLEWILVADADIAHRDGSVTALLDVARRERRDLVSVMARLRTETFWERLLVPPFVYFFHLLYPFRLVASRRSSVAAAAGGCMLVRRRTLERIGGFATIRSALIDDVALGRAVARAGGRLWLGLDAGIRSVRGYGSLGSIWRMVERSAFVQLRFRWSLLAVVLSILALGLVAPALLTVAAGIAVASGADLPAGLG
ncbi:MAG: glycosyltransferase, partial [Thermoanaerobaculia bacterium]|nr:glycosyltransferase [Thermoanaerobaculia bacterium]